MWTYQRVFTDEEVAMIEAYLGDAALKSPPFILGMMEADTTSPCQQFADASIETAMLAVTTWDHRRQEAPGGTR